MAVTKHRVKLALARSTLNKQIAQIVLAVGGFDIVDARAADPVDLIIFQLTKSPETELALISSLLEKGETREVFLIAASAEPAVLMEAMRMGVKEFFPHPLSQQDLRQALQRFDQRQALKAEGAPRGNGQIISVFGSKGGVGTTTVAVNLAISLSKLEAGGSVALLDMNTLFGEIPLFLEMSPKFHWGEITKNIDRLDDTFLSNILTKHKSGVQVLPSPAYLNGHVKPTPDIMARLIKLMKKLFDYIIVDTGQATDDTSLKVLEISNTLLLITILSLPCLTNTNKLLRSFVDFGYLNADSIKVVLNRHMKRSEITLKDAEAGIGKELYWTIPNDFSTSMASINNGVHFRISLPKQRYRKALRAWLSPFHQPK